MFPAAIPNYKGKYSKQTAQQICMLTLSLTNHLNVVPIDLYQVGDICQHSHIDCWKIGTDFHNNFGFFGLLQKTNEAIYCNLVWYLQSSYRNYGKILGLKQCFVCSSLTCQFSHILY